MRLGDITNPDAQAFGKPLDGIRVLAAEQMQALPYATQMLARLGAEVVKIEHPVHGESPASTRHAGSGGTRGRRHLPAEQPERRARGLDLKSAEGRGCSSLAERFDVVAENFKANDGRMGLGYDVTAAAAPRVIYVPIRLRQRGRDPYRDWPAYASIVEAMSGIYEYKSGPEPPVTIGGRWGTSARRSSR
jgi:formyl-CoA transferase